MYCNSSRVTTVYFHDTQVSPLKSLLIEGFRHIRSHNRRLVDYSSQGPRCDAKMVGLGACQLRHWYDMTTRSTERRGEFEFYLIAKAHTPVITFSMVMYLPVYPWIQYWNRGSHVLNIWGQTVFPNSPALLTVRTASYRMYKNIEFSRRTISFVMICRMPPLIGGTRSTLLGV